MQYVIEGEAKTSCREEAIDALVVTLFALFRVLAVCHDVPSFFLLAVYPYAERRTSRADPAEAASALSPREHRSC